MAVLVLPIGPARASFVAADLRIGHPGPCTQFRSQLGALLPRFEFFLPEAQPLVLPADAFLRLLDRAFTHVDPAPPVLSNCSSARPARSGTSSPVDSPNTLTSSCVDERHDRSAHRDPGCVAVPLPRRPLRRRHRNPDHLERLVLAEPGEQLTVDPRQCSSVEFHHDPACLHVDIRQLVAGACVVGGW